MTEAVTEAVTVDEPKRETFFGTPYDELPVRQKTKEEDDFINKNFTKLFVIYNLCRNTITIFRHKKLYYFIFQLSFFTVLINLYNNP